MARQHGKEVRIYLGERDASGDLASIDVTATADTHDATTFASADWKRFDPGLLGWTGKLEAFYDPASGGIGRQLETALGNGTAGLGVLSIYDGDADAVGDTGVLGSEALFKSRMQPVRISDLIKLSGDLDGVGRLGLLGKLLLPHGAQTANFNGTSLDNGASSANGGRANIHVTAISGTWSFKVQHAPDDSTWADLVTFAAMTAVGAQTLEVSGTVDQYLRIIGTEDVAGSVTVVGGFARY